ncbi:hypothetical protein P4E94_11050 [Pontiellaceae bacterium B12219]|nr:hypothetical protein [Pontiellaceae bacterium B12219]
MIHRAKWFVLSGVVSIGSVSLAMAQAKDADTQQVRITVDVKKKPADAKWVPRETRTIETLSDFTPGNAVEMDQYGGRVDMQTEATGFFYPKKIDGRWWLVDPDGNLFIHKAIAGVYAGLNDYSRGTTLRVFGSEENWADFSADLLQKYGFNGCGGWSEALLLRETDHPPVYTQSWDFMADFAEEREIAWQVSGHMGFPDKVWPVFHPDFEAYCDTYAQKLAGTKDDPYCIGHFSDNELQVPVDMLDRTLKLDLEKYPEMKYNVEEANRWLAERKGGSANLDDINDADRDEFIAYMFDRYFQLTTAAIRNVAPNHLCLGSRLHGAATRMPLVLKTAGKYVDIISVNYYYKWDPDPEQIAMWVEQSGKPFIITEWYAKGHDTGLENTSGAGWLVKTQADRARFYHNFSLGLMESKNCVGWHWFKYVDNDPNDLSVDPSNRNSNKGVVTYDYKPYTELLEPMKQLNDNVYSLIDYFDGK